VVEAGNRPQSADVDNDVTMNASTGGASPVTSTLLAESVLDRRYRLIGVLSSRGPVTLWRGDDTVLTRPVAVRVVEHVDDDPNRRAAAQALLSAAVSSGRLVHPGAASTYDATVTTTDAGQVSYVITEWVDGKTLRQLAAEGPPRPDQAAAVVLGASRVLAAAHERGLHHGGLRPGDVIVSGHGTVKVIDLEVGGVLAELDGTGAGSGSAADAAAADVRALGGLLYAALTGTWPLPGDTGLPAAPTGPDGRPLSPRQVDRSVPRDLDAIAMASLGGDGLVGAPITTAEELIAELEAVTPVEALHDTGLMTFGDAGPASTEALPTGFGMDGPNTADYPSTDGYAADGYPARDDGYRGSGSRREDTAYAPGGYGGYPDDRYDDGGRSGYGDRDRYRDDGYRGGDAYPPTQRAAGYAAGAGGQGRGPDPRHGGGRPRQGRGRGPLLITVAVVVVVLLVVGLVLARQLGGNGGGGGPDNPTTSPSASTAAALTPAGVVIFDPPPGDGKENDGDVGSVIDGNQSTGWTTQSYEAPPPFGGLKNGVGFRVAFTQPVLPSDVVVTVGTLGPVTFELHAGDNDAQDIGAYQLVGAATTGQASQASTIQIPSDAKAAKYWVLWLTNIPLGADGKTRGGIAEIQFRS
jgi:hypothetical protein